MDPFVILIIGMVIVVGGILALRLHAFLALVIAALVVAALTPGGAVLKFSLGDKPIAIAGVDGARITLAKVPTFRRGEKLAVLRTESGVSGYRVVAVVEVQSVRTDDKSVGVATTTPGDYQPGDLVVRSTDYDAAKKSASQNIGKRVAAGFGATATGIGILIAMAAIIGKCLLDSGAADRIVRSAMRLTGERGAPLAFAGSGFLLGIPVFFDTVFYLMMPLGKAAYARTGRNYTLYVLSIVVGTTMAHSLVPPTPGPLFVADALHVNLGVMILGGCAVGSITVAVGLTYALWANKRWDIPLRDAPDETLADLQKQAQRSDDDLPPLWLALLPILLPVVLISGTTIVDVAVKAGGGSLAWLIDIRPIIDTLGNKDIALTISAAIALGMLAHRSGAGRAGLAQAVQSALASGGVIILITAAGGAFGAVLRQTDIASKLARMDTGSALVLLPVAFGITTLVRTAQGSATVAMITAVGIVAPLAAAQPLSFHPLYIALAVGCGSKPISWMNDSGFWIVCKMSGFTEAEMLKTLTVMSALMGVTGLAVCMLGAVVLPLI